ncbi:MAG: sigma-70 family RNA polymerase sigma factor [Chloroflexota bacterium]
MNRSPAAVHGGTSATSTDPAPGAIAPIFLTESAFRAWYEDAAPRVYAYLLGRCAGDAALAEELTQQTFVAAVRDRATFDGRADAVTWVIAIARNRLIDHLRRLEREERRHLRIVVREIGADDGRAPWSAADTREQVLAALRALPAAQRAALVLHHVDGLSVREIAAQLGRSPSAIESLLVRARDRFRVLFEESDRG